MRSSVVVGLSGDVVRGMVGARKTQYAANVEGSERGNCGSYLVADRALGSCGVSGRTRPLPDGSERAMSRAYTNLLDKTHYR